MSADRDRTCEACFRQWRGDDASCPVCGWSNIVAICSWCSDSRERTAALIADGYEVSHTICDACQAKFDAQADARRI